MLKPLMLRLTRRPVRLLLPVLLFLIVVISLSRSSLSRKSPSPYYQKKTKPFFPPLKTSSNNIETNYCENFPTHLLDEIQVVLKTGSGDASRKAHLSTVTSCIKNLLIVSDHDEKIGDRRVIDILAQLPASYGIKNPDFEAYAAHKKAHADGDTVDYSNAGWKLDRFKFLPMVDKAYEVNPKAKWYVFLESDVYFFWDTLFRLLAQLDHNELHYMGSPKKGSGGRYFAFGGAGFVLSQGLMKGLLPAAKPGASPLDNRLGVRYEDWVKEEPRGDAVLAYAILNSTGTRLEGLYPTFTGDELKSIQFDRERWCVPLLSFHKASPEQLESLWKWERTRQYTSKAFTYSSFLAYTHAHLRDGGSREFWDNLSVAPVPNDRPAHRNAGSCGSECSADPNCLQYSYSQTVCRFANYIKLGNSVDKENGGQGEFISGWDTGKLAQMGFKYDENKNLVDTSCEQTNWLTPQVT